MGIGTDEFGQPLEQTGRQKKLFKDVFGENAIDFSPPLWWNAQGMLIAEMMPHEWEACPLWSRAKFLAAKRIEGMAKALERYREVMEQRRQKMQDNVQKAHAKRKRR
jgi:hypothetical protein